MSLVKERDLPYATTKVSIETTEADIKRLLAKYGITNKQTTEIDGKWFLKFFFLNKPYMIEIPDIACLVYEHGVWVKGFAKREIARRMMYFYLKSVLENSRYLNVEQLLLAFRVVKINDQFTTVGKAIDSNQQLLLGPNETIF